MSDKKFALVLFLLAILQGLLWTLLAPPWQNPDEPSHFAYVQQLCENGNTASSTDGQRLSQELCIAMEVLKQAKIGWMPFSAFSFTSEERAAAEKTLRDMPFQARIETGEGSNPAGHYPPLYYRVGCLGYLLFYDGSIIYRLFGVRLISVLLSSLTVLTFFFMARSFFGGDRTSVRAASCLMLFHPMHSFMGAVVSCDVMVFFASAILLLICLHIIKTGLKPASLIGVGLCFALGLLAKPSFMAMFPVCLLAVFIAVKRAGLHWRRIIRSPVVLIGTMVFLGLLYGFINSGYLGSWVHTFMAGGNDGSRSFLGYLGTSILNLLMPWTLMSKRLISSYWANFGAMDTTFSFYGFYLLAHAVLLFSMVFCLIKIHKRSEASHGSRKDPLFFSLYGSLVFLVGTMVLGFAISHEKWGGGIVQGRYLFPALSLNLLIITAAIVHSFRSERKKKWAAFVLVGTMMTWHFASYALVFERYYL